MTNPYVQALAAELQRAGITRHEVRRGRKHPRIVFEYQGRKRFYVFPGSPSDCRRGVRNAVADLRRMLRPGEVVVIARSTISERRMDGA